MKSLKNILFLILSMLVFSTSIAQTCLFNDLVDDLVQQNSSFQAFVESEKGFRAWKILATEAPSLRTDMQELTLVLNNLELIENVGTKNYKSWKLLRDAGRTQLMKNADVLETLTRIRANKNLKKIEATDELLAKIQGVEGVSYEQVLNNLDLFANNMAKNNVTLNDFNKVLNQLTQEVSKRDGANWIVEYLAKNSDQFKGKTIKFEEFNSTTLGGRFIDVTDETFSFNKIFYEFKSVKTVPPKDFAEQFMKDLSNADNLSQIKWIFNGSKNPVDFKKNMLEAIDKLPLTENLAVKLIQEKNINKLRRYLKDNLEDIFLLK
ncbi:hypothetical protein [Capnocytophaga sputigena]|jgi:hypothetical protein|uniref:hypothetical protein n=1 Tax=Capnocytophaga sputigena TaxID=1019 RepID=UPI000BB1A54D|nr:hypothetical protein [Capnocytophaga sputigena]ATA70697.1 hypothetical protein CGC57_07195 [Capnocytophaga sputigena]VEI54679.1 Uncharacterised protein [Capnocytophaga sputigena]